MALLPVADALERLLSGVAPTETEMLPLAQAAGRVLADDIAATRTQPPFAASAMDGYALRAADAAAGAELRVVGESRAGERFEGSVGVGEAVRIFTGAPVPAGADTVLIQENTERRGDIVVVQEAAQAGRHIRAEGLDFAAGDILLKAGRRLDPRAIALAAAMNHAALPVRRRPVVALLSTGDELVPAGAEPGPDQIVSSNGPGLTAFVGEAGGEPLDLGIAPDDMDAIEAAIRRGAGADILVLIGGASVGDHDLAQGTLARMGMTLDFWKIAMRPGKPLIVGRLGEQQVLGLPGNPVSAMVVATLFLKPLIRAMLGDTSATPPVTARLGTAMPANDGRQDYVRARTEFKNGERVVFPFSRQDSSMLGLLAAADALIVRPPLAEAAEEGTLVPLMPLD
ncbi:molybdopterin molybdochelatase [Faunimonas pinastri]|uniref:Molybdopterin molybdenumtransferase n=1 Tax=Faunimonas pinastri TaxID=1855383 RepID=A0A1H9J440_9HYPH|nr:gephyrin-like molybdotransferase Glp [Faunimonas pinastri]SEQ81791.1 molybdopterin molybdochelatase [Faunimonas pinastri]